MISPTKLRQDDSVIHIDTWVNGKSVSKLVWKSSQIYCNDLKIIALLSHVLPRQQSRSKPCAPCLVPVWSLPVQYRRDWEEPHLGSVYSLSSLGMKSSSVGVQLKMSKTHRDCTLCLQRKFVINWVTIYHRIGCSSFPAWKSVWSPIVWFVSWAPVPSVYRVTMILCNKLSLTLIWESCHVTNLLSYALVLSTLLVPSPHCCWITKFPGSQKLRPILRGCPARRVKSALAFD